jgi:hypothetical protein
MDPKLEIKKITTEIRELVEENRTFFIRETEKVLRAVEDFEKRYLEAAKVEEKPVEKTPSVEIVEIVETKAKSPSEEITVTNVASTVADAAPLDVVTTKTYTSVEEIQSDKKQLEWVLDHLKQDNRWTALQNWTL